MQAACGTPCAEVKVAQNEVENLKGWQKSQNGAIHRVEAKVDKLQFWIMTTAVGVVVMVLVQILMLLLNKKG